MKKILLSFSCVLLLICINVNAQSVRFVKPVASGTGDGSTWANASGDLQATINAAPSSDLTEIWVAAGTYKPTTGTDRSISFQMKNRCALVGGFAGGETLLSQRNFLTNITILSGDIGTIGVNTDNSYHVISNNNLDNSAMIDGFTISDGYADLVNLSADRGGGMRNISASPTIRNCAFINNTAFCSFGEPADGGAMYCQDGNPEISNCTFKNNLAKTPHTSSQSSGFAQGGAIAILGGSPHITGCTFSSNVANSGDNIAASYGGAVYSDASAVLTNCIFLNNTASRSATNAGCYGGAIYAQNSVSIINCSFYGNHAEDHGGAIGTNVGATISNCIIWGNTASSNAGIDGTATVTYSIVQEGYPGTGNKNADPLFSNSSDPDGADDIFGTGDDGLIPTCGSPGINSGDNASVATSTDIAGNTRIQQTTVDMGAYETSLSSPHTWYYDGDGDGYFGSSETACSSPGAGWSTTTAGPDCNDNDAAATVQRTWYLDADGDGYFVSTQVSCSSPGTGWVSSSGNGGGDCDDSNPNVHPGATEIANGIDDNCDGRIDENIIYVNHAATGANNGTSWADAYTDLSTATGAAGNGNVIWVAQGMYTPGTCAPGGDCYSNKDHAFYMKNNVEIYGGFTGTETLLSQRDFRIHPSILSGNILNPNDATDNVFHVIYAQYLNATAVLDGFTIKDAYDNDLGNNKGGGLYLYQCSCTIRNCIIRDNTTRFASTTDGGAAAYLSSSSALFDHCIFYNNQSSTFTNYPAVLVSGASPSFINCVFTANTGGLGALGGTVQITNCTIANNSSDGIYSSSANFIIKNTIIRNNGINIVDGNAPDITYSITPGTYTGAGNIDADPLFADAADPAGADGLFGTGDDGLIPTCGSTAINSGDNSGVTDTSDITAHTRIQQGIVDMGAYETLLVMQTWYYDHDGDGYYGNAKDTCASPGANWSTSPPGSDCNDDDAGVHSAITYYEDEDGDGYTQSTITLCTSITPGGYSKTSLGGDCNDHDASVHSSQLYYVDADGDGYTQGSAEFCSSTPPAGYTATSLGDDCNDNEATVHSPQQYYVDADHDGFGSTTTALVCASAPPVGYSNNNTDCDDNDASVHGPQTWYYDGDGDGYFGSSEIACSSPGVGWSKTTIGPDCNDNDASATVQRTWYLDADGDGYFASTQVSCSSPGTGWVRSGVIGGGDCDDSDPNVHPGATEIANGKDDNCNGQIDEGLCATPVVLSTTNITANTAQLNWGAITGAARYIISYRPAGGAWTVARINSKKNFYVLTGLNASTRYQWRIRTLCNSTSKSVFSPKQTFKTTKASFALSDASIPVTPDFKMYPNPTSGSFMIDMKLENAVSGKAEIQLINSLGLVIYSDNAIVENGTLKKEVTPTVALASGFYLVKVITGTGISTGRLLIQK